MLLPPIIFYAGYDLKQVRHTHIHTRTYTRIHTHIHKRKEGKHEEKTIASRRNVSACTNRSFSPARARMYFLCRNTFSATLASSCSLHSLAQPSFASQQGAPLCRCARFALLSPLPLVLSLALDAHALMAAATLGAFAFLNCSGLMLAYKHFIASTPLDANDCFLFGALISATDPGGSTTQSFQARTHARTQSFQARTHACKEHAQHNHRLTPLVLLMLLLLQSLCWRFSMT